MTISMNSLSSAWDAFDAYLFDIDGTLLHCADAVHYYAFCHTLTSIAGRPVTLDGVAAHGNTDVGIVRDAFALAGVGEDQWRARLPEIKRAMCEYVQSRAQELCMTVLPGVERTLEYLRGRGAVLGVVTGNLRTIGQLKLERVGLLSYFQFGAWSDAYEFRADVFKAGAAQARELAGGAASLCVVGDTLADISAARENGLHVIAVATGIYPFATLLAADPDLCVTSLQNLLAPAQTLPA